MKYISLVILLLCSALLFSEDLSNIQSAFLDIGYGSRAMGLGGAYTAVTNNAISMVWNPAGLADQKTKHSICFDNTSLLGLYNYSFLGYNKHLDSGASIATGIIYSGDEAMSETTVMLSYAVNSDFIYNYLFSFPDFLRTTSFGFTAKYYSSSFGNNSDGDYIDENNVSHQVTGNAQGYGFDMGFKTAISAKDNIGLYWRNPINSISWDSKNGSLTAEGQYDEKLPTGLLFGYAHTGNKATLSLDIDKALHQDQEDLIKTGIEYRFYRDIFCVRTGYSQEIYTGENKRYSFGTGFKLVIQDHITTNIDVSYQVQTEWEKHNTFRVSCDFAL